MKNKLIASLCLLSFSCYLTGCSNNVKEVETVTTETLNTQNKNAQIDLEKPIIKTESETIKEIEDKETPLAPIMPEAEKEENFVPPVSSQEEDFQETPAESF